MNITEEDYITITNKARVTAAINFVRDVLPGADGVTTEEEQSQVMKILCRWERELYAKIDE